MNIQPTPQKIELLVSTRDVIEYIPIKTNIKTKNTDNIDSELSCARITSTHTSDGKVIFKREEEGFAKTEDIKNWQGNTTLPFNYNIFLANSEFIEKFRFWGMPDSISETQGWGTEDHNNNKSKTPYTDIIENPTKEEYVLKFNTSDYNINRIDGSFIPKAVHFTNGGYGLGINNEFYDLEHVADILSTRNDIVIIVGDDMNYGSIRRSFKLVNTPILENETFKGVIQNIIRYDRDENYSEPNECINFIWRPSEEIYNQMKNSDKNKHKDMFLNDDIIRNINEYDLLGINVAKKHKVEEKVDANSSKRKIYR